MLEYGRCNGNRGGFAEQKGWDVIAQETVSPP